MNKGLCIKRPEKIILESLPVQDNLKENEVKLKVIYGGICGSDVAVFKGLLPHAHYPIIPGHEILGKIIDVGSQVNLEIGARVIVQPNTYCGSCEACKSGKTNICPYKSSLGINVNGGFAEEIVVPAKYVIPVPDKLTNERAILIEPLAVVVHALSKVRIDQNTTVGIIGCGTEGMLAIALASYYGAKVTAIDIKKEKLKIVAEHYRETIVLHPDEVKENQFDIVIEAAGAKESFEQSIDIVKPGGKIVAIGFTNMAEVPVTKLVRKEITIKGSIIYSVPEDFISSIDYLMDSSFHVEPVISHIVSIEQFERAYELALSGKYRKIILKF